MSLLQIYRWICQWKNFENQLTFGEVMGKSLVSCFLRHSVYYLCYKSARLRRGIKAFLASHERNRTEIINPVYTSVNPLPPAWKQSIVTVTSVCLSVCLSVRKHISGTTRQISTTFSCMFHAVARSVLLWRRCDTLCICSIAWELLGPLWQI